MRTDIWTAIAGCLLAATAAAQPAAPPVPPAPPAEELPPTVEFGAGVPVGMESLPGVRPPMPVNGAPIEVPCGPMLWFGADYLWWRAKGGLVPPLVVGVYTSA